MTPSATVSGLQFVPPLLLVLFVAGSLAAGRTLSVWPAAGRQILARRRTEPVAYWLAMTFYFLMAIVSILSAYFFHPSPSDMAPLDQHPGLIAAAVVLGLGLNIAYYWLKARSAGEQTRRRFWFLAALAMGVYLGAPEIFDLKVPSPLWKIALIPIGAGVISYLMVLLNPSWSADDHGKSSTSQVEN
jgi:hypothetical protein